MYNFRIIKGFGQIFLQQICRPCPEPETASGRFLYLEEISHSEPELISVTYSTKFILYSADKSVIHSRL